LLSDPELDNDSPTTSKVEGSSLSQIREAGAPIVSKATFKKHASKKKKMEESGGLDFLVENDMDESEI
jgi:hypothetical protein